MAAVCASRPQIGSVLPITCATISGVVGGIHRGRVLALNASSPSFMSARMWETRSEVWVWVAMEAPFSVLSALGV
jgi:hypothetical protein